MRIGEWLPGYGDDGDELRLACGDELVMLHAYAFEPLGQIVCHVARPIVAVMTIPSPNSRRHLGGG